MKTTRLVSAVAAILGCAFFPSTSFAATLTSGTASFNWLDSGAWSGSTWNNSTPDDAIFVNPASDPRYVSLNGAVSVGNMTFNNTTRGWVIQAGTPSSSVLTVNGNATVGSGSVTFTSSVAGTMNLTSSGGDVVFNDNGVDNTFSGSVALNNARLRVRDNGSLASSVAISFSGASTLNGITGSSITLGSSIAVSDTLTIDNLAWVVNGGLALGSNANLNITSVAANGVALTGAITGNGYTKSGAGLLKIQGSAVNSYSGTVTVEAGEIQLEKTANTNNAITGNLLINGGSVRWIQNNQIADSSTITMNSGTLNLVRTDGTTAMYERVEQLAYNGGSFSALGGLTLTTNASATLTNQELRIDTGGILLGGGSGLDKPTVRLLNGGTISPGTSASGNIGTLGLSGTGGMEWNAGGEMEFNLGAGNSSDQLAITNILSKNGTGAFSFDFLGFNADHNATYTLLTFGSQTGFLVGDFSASNITFDPGFSGSFLLNSDSLQYSVVPEPATWALLAVSLTAMVVFRRRRSA